MGKVLAVIATMIVGGTLAGAAGMSAQAGVAVTKVGCMYGQEIAYDSITNSYTIAYAGPAQKDSAGAMMAPPAPYVLMCRSFPEIVPVVPGTRGS